MLGLGGNKAPQCRPLPWPRLCKPGDRVSAICDLDYLWIQSDSCVSSWLCCGQECGAQVCLYLGTEHLPMQC